MKTNTRKLMRKCLMEDYALQDNEIQVSRKAADLMDKLTEVFIRDVTEELYNHLPANRKRITYKQMVQLLESMNFRRYLVNRLDFKGCY